MRLRITRRANVFGALAVFILLGLSSTTQAQMCGSYGIFLFVTDKSDKAIKNVRVRLLPEVKVGTETRDFRRDQKDAKLFRFAIAEGTSIPGEYELLIEAPGLKTHRQKIKFEYCRTEHLHVKLFKGRDPRPPKSQP